MDEPQWTLRELIAEVATQLARNYEAADNGQVRAIPDERSVRYYTSIGLLDRPAAMRGRTALYGRRHLAQLVAIKRLQAVGKSLAELQQTMATLDDATLSRVSGVVLPKPKRAERRARFWKEESFDSALADARAPLGTNGASPNVLREGRAQARPESKDSLFVPSWTLAIAPGVTLTFELSRAPGAADALALARAAQPLLDELARRQLTLEPQETDR